MKVLSGVYVTWRDGGLEYTYDLTTSIWGNTITWSAKVRREGECVGTLSGTTSSNSPATLEQLAIEAVEDAIERGTGVARRR